MSCQISCDIMVENIFYDLFRRTVFLVLFFFLSMYSIQSLLMF